MPVPFLDVLKQKVVVFDGATGTSIQAQNLTADDFGGEQYHGCNEYLVISKPDAVRKVHEGFLSIGCDVIETDTFGGASIVLTEYNLAGQAYALNVAAARIARDMAQSYSTGGHPRFVAGSIGPTTKLPSLGHIGFREMEMSFYEQVRGLVDGGVDLLCIETCQDLLQTKAALAASFRYFAEIRRRIPVITSVTVESMGTMLLGTEISAALTALEPYDVDVIGMNCATGPKEMAENVRYLASNSPKPVFVMPNAGIPENIGGHAHYKLTPEEMVHYLSHFVKDLGVSVVGGCCGTTPDHIRALVKAFGELEPAKRTWDFTPGGSSLYQPMPFRIKPGPIMVGERTNANGSKLFRDLLGREEWEGMVAMGKEQTKEGAHFLDVCTAYVGRNETADMKELIYRFNTQITLPLVIDSTESPVIEEALMRIGGRAVVNSINLEDGEERMMKILPLCRKYGAAVIALTIDENGMAKTADAKLRIAQRMYDLATGKYGMRPQDLIFDTLTFTLGSGDEEFRKAGMETINAIRLIKEKYPDVQTLLGVSNCSFGLSPHIRHALNSVFLHYAIEAGLDMAIVHASKIMPLFKIPEQERELCRQLIFDERNDGHDPLQELLAFAASKSGKAAKVTVDRAGSIEERLRQRIIDGDKVGLHADLDEGLKTYSPLAIVNDLLLEGMKTVGELFGSGQMQLPFVLQSAEVMKASVAYLEPFMDKTESTSKGTMVIATVKGDVHDIGKNLVDIILTNNGYTVVNLGIKCPLETMLKAAAEHKADAIGMSGLLVKSTLIMKENLQEMTQQGIDIPVVLGGAALTRRFVEDDLRSLYRGQLAYANDAFDGLRFMETVMKMRQGTGGHAKRVVAHELEEMQNTPPGTQNFPAPLIDESLSGYEAKMAMTERPETTATAISVKPVVSVPLPPFYGNAAAALVTLDEIFPFINEVALIRGQWQFRKGKMSESEYRDLLKKDVYPQLERLKAIAIHDKLLEPSVVFGYFPVQSDGNDLIVYKPRGTTDTDGRWNLTPSSDASAFDGILEEWQRFSFPRQRDGRRLCLADFFASRSSSIMDVAAFHLVTMGAKASEYSHRLLAGNKYQEYLYFHGLSVETAEAFAESWHRKIRCDLGIEGADAIDPTTGKLDVKKLFAQHYRGSRYSFGYPACPNLEDHRQLFALLNPARIGVALTEEYQLVPEQSTDAIIVHHPDARYFSI